MGCLEGERWSHHRRIVNPALDQRALRPDLPALIDMTTEMASLLADLPRGQPVELGRTLQHLITHTTAYVWAGGAPGIDEMVLRMSRYPEKYSVLDLVPAPAWLRSVGRRRGSRTGVDQYYAPLDRLIAERRQPDYAGRKDLLWRLVHAPDRQTGEMLTTAEIRDEILTLSATSATPLRAMTWLWYLLALHPWAEERVVAELEDVLGGRTPTPDDLSNLPYMRRLVDEAMRHYPPLPLTLRTAVADDTVCGRKVPRGSIVAVMPWVVHRHRKLWREPVRFDRDGFAPVRARGRPRSSYIPFGVGPHVCPGAALSMNEILAAVAVLVRRLRIRLVPGRDIHPVAWTTLRPRDGLMVTIEPR
jgi:cytochrome P450